MTLLLSITIVLCWMSLASSMIITGKKRTFAASTLIRELIWLTLSLLMLAALLYPLRALL